MSADEQYPTLGEHLLEAAGLFGYKTREALVQLSLDGKPIVQMTPDQARNHALAVLDVAESAEQDGFFFTFANEKLGLTESQAAQFLAQFRDARKDYGK